MMKKTVAKWINESSEPWNVECRPSKTTHRSKLFIDDVPEAEIDCANSCAHVEAHLTTGQDGIADYFETYPSFEEMSGAGMGQVLAVADIMVARKGKFDYIIEICATNSVSDEKMDVIQRRVITDPVYLIEVDADWVIRQSALSRPPVLVAKRIVLLEPNYEKLPYRDSGINEFDLSHEEAVEQEANEQAMYASMFALGSGDPESRMEYWTDGMYIFKGADRWGNVVYSCGEN